MPAYTVRQRFVIAVLGAVLPIAIAAVGIALVLSWVPELPGSVPVHWALDGTPDRYGTLTESVLTVAIPVLAISLIFTAVAAFVRAAPIRTYIPRLLVATSVFVSTLVTATVTLSMSQLRTADAAASVSIVAPMLTGLIAGLALGALAWVLTPRPATAPADEREAEPLALAPDERAVWIRSAGPSSVAFIVIAAAIVLVLAAALLVVLSARPEFWPVVVFPAIIIVLAGLNMYWRVRIDSEAVLLTTLFGLVRVRIPIAHLTGATARTLAGLGEFGGWGIRIPGRKRVGIILRNGIALELTHTDGRVTTITVDDAETAAALVNALLKRAGSKVS